MTSENQHSAAGQALGYLHQCSWALVEFARRAATDPDLQLRLERMDDVDLTSSDGSTDLVQVKHHLDPDDLISSTNVDLWRSLNSWIDLPQGTRALKHLVTTAVVTNNDPLALLRSDTFRNVPKATESLRAIAATSRNKTTATWREKFSQLGDDQQEALLSEVFVEDNSPRSADIEAALIAPLRYAIRIGKEKAFLQLLRGWWNDTCSRLLAGEIDAVKGTDLLTELDYIADQMATDNLPLEPDILAELDRSIAEDYGDRRFVAQLLWIAFDNDDLWRAIRDYHRSFVQRSFWLRHQLVGELELDQFAFKLHDEWEQIFAAEVRKMKRDGRTDLDIVGQEILEALTQSSRARVRERFNAPWFNRGMFHALADGELAKQIGWHPEFESRLIALLGNEVAYG